MLLGYGDLKTTDEAIGNTENGLFVRGDPHCDVKSHLYLIIV